MILDMLFVCRAEKTNISPVRKSHVFSSCSPLSAKLIFPKLRGDKAMPLGTCYHNKASLGQKQNQ